MTKLLAIAVCDNSRHMIVSPVVDAGEENENKLATNILSQVKESMKKKNNVSSITPSFKKYKIPYETITRIIVPKIDISSQYADGTIGPSAHVWFYYIKDLHISEYIIACFDNRYQYPDSPKVWFASPMKINRDLTLLESKLVSRIYHSCEDHQYYRYYRFPMLGRYSLMIYDPRVKDAAQSIRSRLYSAKLQQ